MKVAVWDTYVSRADGLTMHFDILVDADNHTEDQVFKFGRAYLRGKPFGTESLASNECKFCHIEEASDKLKQEIHEKGYSIIEMENCD